MVAIQCDGKRPLLPSIETVALLFNLPTLKNRRRSKNEVMQRRTLFILPITSVMQKTFDVVVEMFLQHFFV
jgi:hypothetical protein